MTMTPDHEALHAWRNGGDRRYLLEGRSVILYERRDGAWFSAAFTWADTAALALSAQLVPWRASEPPPEPRPPRQARGRATKPRGRAAKPRRRRAR